MALSPEESTQTIGAAPAQTRRDNAARYLSGEVVMMALIGGLILNLMPCVLPVLGMKLGSGLFVGERKKAALTSGDGTASVAGIVRHLWRGGVCMTLLRLSNHALARESSSECIVLLTPWRWLCCLFSASLFGLLSSSFPHL